MGERPYIPMGAITDLLKSERGLIAVVLAVAASVLMGMGKLSAEQWTGYTQWIFTAWVAGKTISGVATAISNKPTSTTVATTQTTEGGAVTTVTKAP